MTHSRKTEGEVRTATGSTRGSPRAGTQGFGPTDAKGPPGPPGGGRDSTPHVARGHSALTACPARVRHIHLRSWTAPACALGGAHRCSGRGGRISTGPGPRQTRTRGGSCQGWSRDQNMPSDGRPAAPGRRQSQGCGVDGALQLPVRAAGTRLGAQTGTRWRKPHGAQPGLVLPLSPGDTWARRASQGVPARAHTERSCRPSGKVRPGAEGRVPAPPSDARGPSSHALSACPAGLPGTGNPR